MIDLVTGAAGFLGSHLCDALLARGHDVIGLDNFFTGSKDNIRHLRANDHFEIIRHDIIQPILLEVDRIYNLACPASPVHYQFNPVKTIKTSVLGTINMLGLAKRVKARILQASTSEVYGDPEEHPQKESYWGQVNPIGPRSCYDEGKRVAEIADGQLPAAEPRRHPHRAHLQHLRPAHGPERRPGGQQLHPAGPARRADHHLRPRRADPFLLLCLRPGRRHDAHDGAGGLQRPGQPRQPRGDHHPRAGRAGSCA